MKPQLLFALRLSVLSIATLLWILVLWGGYAMVDSGIDSRMMGYEVMTRERNEEMWRQLVRESLQRNLTAILIFFAFGVIIMRRWIAFWRRLRKPA